jgi:crossover junction endodeoxyribonuclease RuvC
MNAVYTIGLDIAASTGFVLLHGENCIAAKQLDSTGPKHRYDRADFITKGILGNLPLNNAPRLILIEDYIIGHASSAVAVVELGAIIRYNLRRAGLSWLSVKPATLKKWTAGNGAAKKPKMAAACKERWGVTFKCDDVTDAYALARLGQDPDVLNIAGVIQS